MFEFHKLKYMPQIINTKINYYYQNSLNHSNHPTNKQTNKQKRHYEWVPAQVKGHYLTFKLPEVINMKLLPIIFIHYSASNENILTYQVEDATLI